MRILSVAAELPWPPRDGTRLRSWHFLSRLAATDDIVLITWAPPGSDPGPLPAVLAGVTCLPLGTHRRSAAHRLARRVRALAGGAPPWIQAAVAERSGHAGVRAATAAAVAEHRRRPFDVVVAESEAAAFLAPRLAGVPFVVHRHNVFGTLMAQLGAPRPELGVWRRFDRATVAGADLIVTTTPESAAAVTPFAGATPVRVVPNGVELRPPAPAEQRCHVAFVGGLDYAPNRQGLGWFVERVWPLVQRPAGCELKVVGQIERVGRLPHAEGVRYLGRVADLDAALADAAVGVAPLLAGMGIKNKTLDFLARGLPVVATRSGAEGLSRLVGRGLVVAETPEAFAREVTALLAAPERAVALGAEGRAAVAGAHSWDAVVGAYRSALAATVERAGARP